MNNTELFADDVRLDRRSFIRNTAAAMAVSGTLLDDMGLSDARRETKRSHAAPDTELRIQRLSWAGIKMESGTRTLFIDPFVTPSIWDGAWTMPIVPLETKNKTRYVLPTHLHNDHFDPDAVRQVLGTDNGSVVCHSDVALSVASRGFRTIPLQMFEPTVLGPFTVLPVPAVDGVNDRQVSWVISIGGKRFIHCGDTLYHGGLNRIGKAYGPFDAAFLPINGAQVLAVQPHPAVPMSMTPEQAVGAALLLGAKLVVPIHYGLHDENSYLEYPEAQAKFEAVARGRHVAIRILAPGDWL